MMSNTQPPRADERDSPSYLPLWNRAPPRLGNPAGPVPLVVGVTGHGDLLPEETPRIREAVRQFFRELTACSPTLSLTLMSGLAEGADRLVAEEALALGIDLVVVLPMSRELYAGDFATPESRQEFDALCSQGEVVQLRLLAGMTDDEVATKGEARNRQYAQLGIFLCAHCHVLLALWDGKPSNRLGGTAQVVGFHHHDVMPGFTPGRKRVRDRLIEDESDLIYHIVVSRNQPDGSPLSPLAPLESAWLTTSHAEPRTRSLPVRYQLVFTRIAEFNADCIRYAAAIARERRDLPGIQRDSVGEPLAAINQLFVISDWLAGHYQQQFHAMLRRTHTLAVLMGLAYVAYADIFNDPLYIFVFLCLFAAGLAFFAVSSRGAWHRRYLDYRALAEGLRIQYFWAIGGVRQQELTKFAHDNFLQKQDVELGWIRNVMRVAGLYTDVAFPPKAAGLQLAIDNWIGDDDNGQISYYAKKARHLSLLHTRTQFISVVCLSVGITLALGLMIYHADLSTAAKMPLKVLMAMLPLIAATRDAHAHKRAEKELVKQYRFMHRVFQNARRQLVNATSDEERREILRAVGDAALDEHAEWILVHRERPLEFSKL